MKLYIILFIFGLGLLGTAQTRTLHGSKKLDHLLQTAKEIKSGKLNFHTYGLKVT